MDRYKNKKIIAFDLDDTLVVSKSNVTPTMAELLAQLLDKYEVCVISGGAFSQFKVQLIDLMEMTDYQKSRMHIMPTSGTKYYLFDKTKGDWQIKYDIALSQGQRAIVIKALEEGAKKLGLWEANTYGDIIEDRGSQVTFSALGQQAPPDLKHKWDSDGKKREELREYVSQIVPDLEVRAGGSTSVDVTMKGADKGFGMQKLIEQMGISKEDILFIGDRLQPGGNDHAVKAMGIDSIEVVDCDDAEKVIEDILNAS